MSNIQKKCDALEKEIHQEKRLNAQLEYEVKKLKEYYSNYYQ